MEKDKKSSDEILKELFSSINDITDGPPSEDPDPDSSSSSDDEQKVKVKKEKKSKRSHDSDSKRKHKKKKKNKKSSAKRKSSNEKKLSKNSVILKDKNDKVKVKIEKELPLLEVLKKEMIESVPCTVTPLPEELPPTVDVSEFFPAVIKQEKLEELESDVKEEKLPTETKDEGESNSAHFNVADVFIEDMLESGIKPPNQNSSDTLKKTIQIQDLKNSSILAEAEKKKVKAEESQAKKRKKREDGELSGSSDNESDSSDSGEETEPSSTTSRKKRSHKKDENRHKSKKKKSKRGRKERKSEDERSNKRSERSSKHLDGSDRKHHNSHHKTRHRSRSSSRSRDYHEKLRHRSTSLHSHRSHREQRFSRSKSRDHDRDWRDRSRSGGRHKERKGSRENSREPRDLRRKLDRHGGRNDRDSHKSRKEKDEFYIDKRKLLEIARRNALSMMKQGQVGTDIDKVVHITAGGKTVDQLTDFCKHLSQKEATGLESVSSETSSEDDDQPFHHPFQLKERPNIVMNIRNCASIPIKTHQEKATDTLRLQFPVSSGTHHRKNENEWIPVSPKKTEPKTVTTTTKPKETSTALVTYPTPAMVVQPTPILSTAYPPPVRTPTDIGAAITERLNAIRHEQDATSSNFNAGSGIFTGSTGAKLLSPLELASGQQAWARKDQLMSATPVTGGMGMSLLQKMGWKPGEGLGKNHEGTLEPLKLPVKMDKRGLVCAEEMTWRQRQSMNRATPKMPGPQLPSAPAVKSLEGKHPVSLLVEFCTRRRYDPPVFDTVCEEGPPHQKRFILKVTVNGVDYQPAVSSSTKKIAKSEAARVCLKNLGVLPNT